MGDINCIGAVVKILEKPEPKFIKSNILFIKFRVQLPQVRKRRVITLVIWGKLARSVLNYYKINDYILIEGYVSLQARMSSNKKKKPLKKVIVTALKVYPFLFDSTRSLKKLS
jgi:single-stranded DNA-binding protein